MEGFVYRYKCEKTGLTYSIEKLRDSRAEDEKTMKLEVPCPYCGGKHTVFVEKK
jgi:hypothetical protein